MDYLVEWSIEVAASSPREAAEEALRIQRDENSLATVFVVYDDAGSESVVDVSHERAAAIMGRLP